MRRSSLSSTGWVCAPVECCRMETLMAEQLGVVGNQLARVLIAFVAMYVSGRALDSFIGSRHQLASEGDPDEVAKEANRMLFTSEQERSGARILGAMERLFFFGSFSLDRPILVAAWLGYKLASKWQVWEQIIQLPARLGIADDKTEARWRLRYGTNVLHRWLIGSLGNLMIGGLGFAAYLLSVGMFPG